VDKITAQRLTAKMRREAIETRFAFHCRASGIAVDKQNYRFHATRSWALDFAWVMIRVAVECDGGVFTQGRHTRGAGYSEDCIKINEATKLGWQVYRFTGEQVKSGHAIDFMIPILAPTYGRAK
jgi:very-short-patch-repair endonuclease